MSNLHRAQRFCGGPSAAKENARFAKKCESGVDHVIGQGVSRRYASLPTKPFTRADTMEMTMEATKALPKVAM